MQGIIEEETSKMLKAEANEIIKEEKVSKPSYTTAGVEYDTGLDEGTDEDSVDKSYILDRLSKMEETEPEETVAEEMPVEQIPEPMDTGGGLMSRRI